MAWLETFEASSDVDLLRATFADVEPSPVFASSPSSRYLRLLASACTHIVEPIRRAEIGEKDKRRLNQNGSVKESGSREGFERKVDLSY